jgi:acyl-CoA thioesterase FadM
MALSDLSLSYKAPLRAGDTFYVTTAIAQVGVQMRLWLGVWCSLWYSLPKELQRVTVENFQPWQGQQSSGQRRLSLHCA